MKRSLLGLGAGVLFTVGCGNAPVSREDVASDTQAITGGGLLGAPQIAPDSSVVKIQYTDAIGTHTCTALKIASHEFWTAGHCLDSVQPGTTVFKVTNRLDGVFTGAESYERTVTAMDVHPTRRNWYNAIAQPTRLGRTWHYDVGRFVLSATTPNIPSYASSNAHSTWLDANQSVTYTGYGCDNVQPSNSGQKQIAWFTLSDFPTVRNELFDAAYDIYAHSMVNVGDLPQGCPGDSGSPVQKLIGGVWKIVGITSNGGNGWTAMQRFSNVGSWLLNPTFNQFRAGFTGSLVNQISGRCAAYDSFGRVLESACDLRNTAFSNRTWKLLPGPAAHPNTFYIVNAANNNCLDLETLADGSNLVLRNCAALVPNTMLWKFNLTKHSDYRTLVNNHTGRCTVPSNKNGENSLLRSSACLTFEPAWRNEAWMMVR